TRLVALPLLLTQLEFFDFARGGLGEVAEFHRLRALKMRHVLAAEGDNLFCAGLHPRLENDKRFRDLTPALVWDGHHGDFLHGGLPVNGISHLNRENILAATNDDVLLAVA